MKHITRLISTFLLLSVLPGCASAQSDSCPVTEPVWIKPPDDSAVNDTPTEGYYFVNKDRSIWASAWWTGQEGNYLYVKEDGIKEGWFRPAGAELQITGQRLDADAPPLEAHVPCCYPTRFQATGLYFPTEGCWEVTARADDSVLSFIVQVAP
jgi:hypothetical protein